MVEIGIYPRLIPQIRSSTTSSHPLPHFAHLRYQQLAMSPPPSLMSMPKEVPVSTGTTKPPLKSVIRSRVLLRPLHQLLESVREFSGSGR